MLFIYEATDKDGALVRGEHHARNKREVVERLKKQGFIPVSVKEKGKLYIQKIGGIGGRVTAMDRIALVRNLATTIKAGVSILEAVEILIADTPKGIMRKILVSARAGLQNGQPLSSVFEAYKKHFPPVFVGMVRAGEASGQLSRVLDELARHLAKEYNLVRKMRSALAYPVILLVGSTAVVVLLLVFILPRLAKTFASAGTELPGLTVFLIGVGNVLSYSLLLDLFVLGVVVWFFVYARRMPWGSALVNAIMFHLPIARDLVKKIALVRFSRTFGNIIGSGIPILEALELSAEAVGNNYYKTALLKTKEEVKNGVSFSEALRKYPHLFPRMFVSMVAVGEKTGTLENIFKNFADFYEEGVDATLKDLTTFLEPLLLALMGVVIGVIAISVLLPIYQLVGSLV
ncbi:MAG: type II secretion system F family protein [Patescibacteria group bacterium]|nr:MAG: type II secretion system F family protein [Patescibacteria group bacterium]